MYSTEENRGRRGTKCLICTGCGRCPGTLSGVRVVTGSRLPLPKVNLENPEGLRLVAADVGTTTIAMQLYRADGSVEDEFVAVNPQVRYGADVLSRIQAVGEESAGAQMQRMVREVLKQGIRRFQKRLSMDTDCSTDGGRPADAGLLGVLAANTAMVYLLMGWNPSELGRAPFTAVHLEGTKLEIAGVPFHVFPGLSAHVGGDILAGILASGMQKSKSYTLLIDLGTNGEMALGNCEGIALCSTAAGPAFEGGVNRGVWGADMAYFLARMRREGLLDETGLLAEEYFENGVSIGNVCVTQEAVRAIQLAKGAVYAGTKVLAEESGVPLPEIDRVVLAGGFGYYLNPQDAADIGLLPRCLAEKSVAGGNTALAGGMIAGEGLLGGALRDLQETKAGLPRLRFISLAENPSFQEKYIEAMNFPAL